MRLDEIPPAVVEANRERGHSDERICQMSAIDLFDEYCMWHGLINWGRNLFHLATNLRDLESSA